MERRPHDYPGAQDACLFVVLHVSVDVKRLFELGKGYPWPRPKHCLSCSSRRIWGHGYVRRYFENFVEPLWVKRFRCPECGTVYTLRPDLFFKGFRYSLITIILSLIHKITDHRFLSSISRQMQQYWYRGFIFQSSRHRNVPSPDMDTLREIFSLPIVPVSRSLKCAYLRL
jgi:hypothetical protein